MPSAAPRLKLAPLAKQHRVQTAPEHYGKGRGGKAKTGERGYGWQWQKARKRFLERPENVLCRMCESEGKLTVAKVVDHIIPHRGDHRLFWDESNWQPLCKWHHDSVKQAMEKRERRALLTP